MLKKSISSFIYRNSTTVLVFWILFIFLLCATPGQFIPTSDWLELLSVDKWVHAGIFFVLGVLFFLFAFKHKQNERFLYVYTVLGVFYGVGLEVMQARWFSNRSFDYMDMLANAMGGLIALSMHKAVYWWFKSYLKTSD
jgi:VanZ family protein